MFETVINLKPQASGDPGMTIDKLIAEMDKALQVPRRGQLLDHADQGAHRHAEHRHPHAGRGQGLRQGPGELERWRARSRRWCAVPGTSSAYAERVTGGYYLDIVPRRGSSRATGSPSTWCRT
jgi:Cu(I)/Ag(I) efflux system membrane protein CusA/SilA